MTKRQEYLLWIGCAGWFLFFADLAIYGIPQYLGILK